MNENENLDNHNPENPLVPEPVVPESSLPQPESLVEETLAPPIPEIPTVTPELPTPEIPTVTPELPTFSTPEAPQPPTIPTIGAPPTFETSAPLPPTIPTVGGSVPPPASQGDWSSQAGGQVPSYTGVAPQPKRSTLPIIVGIAAIIVIGVVVFMLTRGGGKSKLAANPEDTLFAAMDNTGENISSYPGIFPESSIDYTNPLETNLDLSLDASRNKYLGIPDYLSNMRLKLNLKQDSENREFLFGFQFESPIFTLDHSEFYINPQEALFSIPNLYSGKDFVRIDFATFTEKWNASDLSEGAKINEDINITQSITDFLDLIDETVSNVKELDEVEDIETLMKPANDKLKEASTISHLETTDKTFDFKVVIPPDAMTLYVRMIAEQTEELAFRQNRRIAEAIPASLYDMLGSSPEQFLDSSMNSGSAYEALKTIIFEEDITLIITVDRDVNRISHVKLESTSFIPDSDYQDDAIYMAGTLSLATGEYAINDFNLNLFMSPEPEGWKTADEFAEIKVSHKAPEGDLVGNYIEMIVSLDDGSGDIEGMKFVVDLSWNKEKAATEPMIIRMTMEDLYYEDEYGVIVSALVDSGAGKFSLKDGQIVIKEGAQDLLNFDFNFSIASITDPVKPVHSTTADFFDVDWRAQMESFITTVSMSAYAMM